jgi:hypothetical protein
LANDGWQDVATEDEEWKDVPSPYTEAGAKANPPVAPVPQPAGITGKPFQFNTSTHYPHAPLTPDQQQTRDNTVSGLKTFGKGAATTIGSVLAPEALPELTGVGGVLARAAASGVGAGLGTSAGQAMTGQNPISRPSLKESGTMAGEQAAIGIPFEAAGEIPGLKLGRSMINRSVGATARDVTYGNPAKALLENEITVPHTGDIEAYKAALKQGKSMPDAMQAAGGRMAAVSGKINELTPQLDNILNQSQARLPVRDVIDKPLLDSMNDIILHRAMTKPEKDAAIATLGGLQQELKAGLGQDISPKEAVEIKRMIGSRINWGGNIAVTDEVKPAYRQVYSTLNNAVHQAVPEAKDIDENLTNLLAAQSDLHNLSKAEEVGRSSGLTGGTFGPSFMGRLESGIGRGLPAVAKYAPTIGRVIGPIAIQGLNKQP